MEHGVIILLAVVVVVVVVVVVAIKHIHASLIQEFAEFKAHDMMEEVELWLGRFDSGSLWML